MELQATSRLSLFARYAWLTVGYNILVILWGVFLRASHSGDGCGQHWLTCGGEIVPSAPQLKTLIEFSHRITTAIAGFVVLLLVIWAFRVFAKGHIVRKMAMASFLMIIVEALIGAGLVLTGNTAGADTPTRPYWTAGHLISTFVLLAVLTMTAWYANGRKPFSFKVPNLTLLLLGIGIFAILLVGISGSVAALSSMLFPSASIAEGVAKDLSGAHILLRLRVWHPILSIALAVYLIFISLWVVKALPESISAKRWANRLTILIVVQLAVGGITLITLAPIVMQLVHLLLADLVWIVYVLMAVETLAEQSLPAETEAII